MRKDGPAFTTTHLSAKLKYQIKKRSARSAITGGTMKIMTINRLLFLVLFFFSLSATAENSTSIPGYTIHHNALPTASLDPEVANQYRIQRSKYRGMLNVSVIKDIPGSTGKSVDAIVMANATNIRGQLISIPMRKVTEGEAIYFIGEFRIADQETLNFHLQVKPKGETRFYKAQLSQEF
ncbi:MAG: DUF4426 domain-containing protein, partial [Chromatiales bacterium]